MSTCTPTPTATQSVVITSDVVVTTSFSSATSSVPYLTTTRLIGECAPEGNSTDCTTQIETSYSTVITSVPVLITSQSLTTVFTTQYGTVCVDGPPDEPENPTPSTDGEQQQPDPETIVTVVTSMHSTTLPGGQVTVSYFTVTDSITKSGSPTPSTSAITGSVDSTESKTSSKLPAIIGGVAGGIGGILLLILLGWYLMRRRRQRWDDVFSDDDNKVIAHTGSEHKYAPAPTSMMQSNANLQGGGYSSVASPSMSDFGSSNMMHSGNPNVTQWANDVQPAYTGINAMHPGSGMMSAGPSVSHSGDYGMHTPAMYSPPLGRLPASAGRRISHTRTPTDVSSQASTSPRASIVSTAPLYPYGASPPALTSRLSDGGYFGEATRPLTVVNRDVRGESAPGQRRSSHSGKGGLIHPGGQSTAPPAYTD